MVRKRHCDGFTLVEVLIALTLTAVLVTLLFEALHTYAIANSVGYARVQAQETAASLRAFLRTQLREIVPLGVNTSDGQELFFRGDAQTLSYSGRIPSHRAPGGLYKISFVVEGASPDQSLTFRYARIPDPEALAEGDLFDFTDTATKVMLESAAAVSFEYFGVHENDIEASWVDTWRRHDQIPEMIRIRIQIRDSELE
ncbi:MAG: prepilin-type N-terminal cleavage/methylation domain-containing protein, partial [Proteobacteria bacterium]|nr:prepilin-type N-terminal cleavage/methylation domain-containing protein [Pseudomonadota bacterium]